MPNHRKITTSDLRSLDEPAHRALLNLEGLAEVIEIETDGGRHSAIVRFTGDGESDATVVVHYGPDTALEWLEF